MSRDRSKDGFLNRVEAFLLTRFEPLWRCLQRIRTLKSWLNRFLIRRAILKTKTRPHRFSCRSDYTSWDSLTDRTFTGRHLPPADEDYLGSLPDVDDVVKLFHRHPGRTRYSAKSTLLFTSFAQWFTDGFLRTDGDGEEKHLKNTSNHEIDLSPIYGLKSEQTKQLRELIGGRLKTSTREHEGQMYSFPPTYYDESGRAKDEFSDLRKPLLPPRFPAERLPEVFAGGVERLNVTIGYAMFNTLFVREHNRICRELATAYPEWGDEKEADARLFQTARNILIVILIRIVIGEYINHITPYHFQFSAEPWGFKKEPWYRTNWMTMEFNLLYRWHSMIPDTFLVDGEHRELREFMFNNEQLTKRGLGPTFQDASNQVAAEVGLLNTHPFLLKTEENSIELGRKAKLRSYNDYREAFGYPRVTNWAQITGDTALQQSLKKTYKSVDCLELYTGLFAEEVRTGSALSPLIGRMVGVDAFSQALTNPLLSVNVFREETFTPVGWRMIHETNSLNDLLHRNLESDSETYEIRFTTNGEETPVPDEGAVVHELQVKETSVVEPFAQQDRAAMIARAGSSTLNESTTSESYEQSLFRVK